MLLGLLSTWSSGCGCSHSPTRRWLHRGGSSADHCFLRNGAGHCGMSGAARESAGELPHVCTLGGMLLKTPLLW